MAIVTSSSVLRILVNKDLTAEPVNSASLSSLISTTLFCCGDSVAVGVLAPPELEEPETLTLEDDELGLELFIVDINAAPCNAT